MNEAIRSRDGRLLEIDNLAFELSAHRAEGKLRPTEQEGQQCSNVVGINDFARWSHRSAEETNERASCCWLQIQK